MNLRLTLLLLAVAAAPAFAVETLKTRNGRTLDYETLICDPSTPKTAVTLKNGSTITALKLSEIDLAALPEADRTRIAAYTKEQKSKAVILLEDEWVNRDEYLLKSDKRFAYDKKLHRVGTSLLELVNDEKVRVTIGLRITIKADTFGTEFSVESGKKKSIQVPDGTYLAYVVRETENDTELSVTEHHPGALKNLHLTLTVGGDSKDAVKGKDAGTIAIPQEMRRE